ncbi:MAG TPA: MYXO-CTERM sorting domain-containing protein [Polyangiaceae bacterium]|nr:MYXO-CTERM sorting domain-containing protein [Polyangiaceae bacterium]
MPLPRLLAVAGLIAFTVAPAAFAQTATKEWQSGFETGFPGEFLDYDDGSWSATGEPVPGTEEVWTIVDDSDPRVMWGSHAYKGFPTGPDTENHRCYPVVYLDVPSPAVNSFMAYIDADFSQVSASEWIHLATYANNPDWVVFTMSVRDKKLEMAHLDWDYVGPAPQPDFPLRKWVRMTTYMEFNGASTLVHVWQDGVHIFQGTFTDDNGTTLQRVHWGWYSSPGWTEGVEYNDEIQVWSLSDKITDFTEEPESPYGTPDGSGGTGGMGGTGGTSNGAGGGGGVDEGNAGADSSGGTTASGGRSSGGSSGQARGGGAGRSNAGASSGGAATNGGSSNTTGGTGAATNGGSGGGSSGGRSSGGAPNGGTSGATSGSGTAPAAPSSEDDDSGCGCRTAPHEPNPLGWLAVGALGLASFAKRRSQRRPARSGRSK